MAYNHHETLAEISWTFVYRGSVIVGFRGFRNLFFKALVTKSFGIKNNFVLRWLRKLFDNALVCVVACGALAMCLQNALAYIHFLSRI